MVKECVVKKGAYLDNPENVVGNVKNNGITSLGNSPGTATIDGDFEQTASGSLLIEIGGRSPGTEFDQLTVTGSAVLDGTAHLTIIDGFQPTPGERFEFVRAPSITGSFNRVLLGQIDTGIGFEIDDEAGSVFARVVPIEGRTYEDWLAGAFTPEQLGDSLISGPEANPDGDRWNNLLEYVFDTDPNRMTEDVVPISIARDGPDRLEISFPWTVGTSGIRHELFHSSDLQDWAATDDYTSSLSFGDNVDQVTLTLNAASLTNDHRFFRVQFTQE